MAATIELMSPRDLSNTITPSGSIYQFTSAAVVDIRSASLSQGLASSIRSGLKGSNGPRTLPSLLLWDEAGLQYFEEVRYTPEYYLTDTEIALLEAHALQLGRKLCDGTMLLELGSGNLRKTNILLEALERLGVRIDYYALDLDRKELDRTLRQLDPNRFKYIRVRGLLGTYDDGRAWIARSENEKKPKCILSLGSTLGCMSREEAGDFCREWATTMQQSTAGRLSSHNSILLGLDNCQDAQKVSSAYCDSAGANKRFILHALENGNSHLGYTAFDAAEWTVKGTWNSKRRRHEQHLVPLKDVWFEGNLLREGEHILVANSHKYSRSDLHRLASDSGLQRCDKYQTDDGTYGLYLFTIKPHTR